MNCKPGDLAVIVKADYGGTTWAVGRIVTCKSSHVTRGHDVWKVLERMVDPRGIEIESIPDASLRPIRDPGDDAKDQTLEWLPVPSKETERA